MRFLSETTTGVSEHRFALGDVTGVLQSSAGAGGDRPLIPPARRGGRHEKAPSILAHAHHDVTTGGFAVAAIGAPGHGDRPRTAADEAAPVRVREAVASGGPAAPLVAAHNAAPAALFDAFASRDETLHANPGRHLELPASEVESEHRFFAGRLARASGARPAHL
ncbi:hypothetical protein ABZ479_16590 [Streptomyces sp. NPDC005722]